MRARTEPSIWHLTTSAVEIVSDHRARIMLRTTLVAVLVALATLAGLRMYTEATGPVTRAAELQHQSVALAAELAQLRAELALERATRAALEQQVIELNERSSNLESQLNFFNAQSGRARTGRVRE